VRYEVLPPSLGGWPNELECAVVVNAQIKWSWPMLCAVVTHEIGHLRGMPHSEGVMDANMLHPELIPGCRRNPRKIGRLASTGFYLRSGRRPRLDLLSKAGL